ncbi:MAG TPA: hypothetical protein VGN57_08670 [Pirellulaceae bacterium]|nr:hypothetical protein [Pirellulaceae bacterium]
MLMIASNQGRQWAVGVAAGVFHNDERTEMPLIAAELGLEESWRELWELPLVRRRHENDETKFREFWSGQFHWLQWKTDQALYHWFDRPFALDPMKLKGKQSLVREFGAFQPLEPGAILRLLRGRLPESKAGILRWFQQGPFDQRFHDGYPASDKSGGEGASAAPTSRQVRYWIEGERICEPLHAALQARYVNFLRSEGFEPVENVKGVDVRYRRAARTVFVEVKPTEKVLSRFAIRFAVGQLLEYRHALDEQAELEVVISSQPETPQIEFLRSLGIGLCCQHGNSFTRIL